MSNLNSLPRMAVIVALLMVMPTIMTATPAGANTPAIIETLTQAGVRPGSDFTHQVENTKFYLHTDDYFLTASNPDPNQVPGDPGAGTPVSGQVAFGDAYIMDMARPTDEGTGEDSRGISMGPALEANIGGVPLPGAQAAREQPRFDMTPGLHARDEFKLYRIAASVWVGGMDPLPDVLPTNVFMDVYAYPAGGERPETPETTLILRREGSTTTTSGSTIHPGPVARFSALEILDDTNGVPYPATTTFSVQFRLQNGVGVLWADTETFESSITLRSDSARIAMWTEDRRNTVRDVFPPGTNATPAADRRVNVIAAHFNVWAGIDCLQDQPRVGDCPIDNIDQTQHQITINKIKIDAATGLRQDLGSIPLDQGGLSQGTVAKCCTTDDLINYKLASNAVAVFRYSFFYGGDFDDGIYHIKLFQPKGHPNGWALGRDFRTGLVDFTIEAAPGEILSGGKVVHKILAGEETHFTVRVSNLGAAPDTISVAVPPPPITGWTATINTPTLVIGPGEHRDVTVIVKSPPTAATTDSVELRVSAVSSLDQRIKTLPLVTNVVATNIPGVTLSSTKSQMEVRPNQESALAISIRNDGFARSSFLISKKLGGSSTTGNCADWIFTLTPPSIALHSSSRSDLIVGVTPPVNTVPGTACLATFQATAIGDSTVKSTLTLPIKVLVVNEVQLGVHVSNERTWREPADDHPLDEAGLPFVGGTRAFSEDTVFDLTAIYRLQITNSGDQTDVYQLRGSWNPNVGTHTGECAGDEDEDYPYDGIPNAWGFSFPPSGSIDDTVAYGANRVLATSQAAAFSGVYTLADLEVQPGETLFVPLELGTAREPGTDACPNTGGTQAVSSEAEFTVTVRSALDQTVTKRLALKANYIEPGAWIRENVYEASLHDLSIDMGLRDGRVASDLGLFTKDGASDDISFPIRVINRGNEKESATIQVEAGYDGWEHKIVSVANVHPGNTCSPNDSQTVDTRQLRCQAGVYDEIIANVVLTPPADVTLGERHSVQVFASVPGQEGVVSISKRVTARVVGTFDYDLRSASPLQQVAFGQSVRLPFTIQNLGTQGDTFQIQLANSQQTAGWTPSLSLTNVFVPALARWHGFVTVTPPAGILPDAPATQFQVLVTSTTTQESKIVTVSAKAIAATEDFFVFGDPESNLIRRAEPTSIFVKVSDLTGKEKATVTRVGGLPEGWSMTNVKNVDLPLEQGQASAEFKITAPADALGTSRLPIRFKATSGDLSQQADVMINLASSYGVGLATPDDNATLIQAGSHANFVLEVTNRGLSQDTIDMSGLIGLPSGWTASFSPSSVPLQPLESRDITLTVNAPAGATPGQQLELVVFASSLGDDTRGASVTVKLHVGLVKLDITPVADPVYAGPESRPGHTLLLKNNGTLPLKNLVLSSDGGTFDSQLDASFSTAVFEEILPGDVRETRLSFQLPPDIRQRANVPVEVEATSTLDALANFKASSTTNTVLLPYEERDVDRDGFREYAVDANRDGRDGKEAFAESASITGVKTTCLSCTGLGEPGLARFLTPEARATKQVDVTVNNETVKRLSYVTDANDDGSRDLFLDTTGDQLPDRYWDANRTVFQDLTRATLKLEDPARPGVTSVKVLALPKDVTGDGILDYFIDTDGDGLDANGAFSFEAGTLDVFFDLTTGRFGKLIPKDINSDNIMDYVVDLNGDERPGDNEPVLFASAGRLASLLLADMDGDGALDEVYTYEGRGPNCFIRRGVGADGKCFAITLKDVTRDGKDDWTYDIDGDGRIESYYDPVTGKSGKIDTQSQFVQSLVDYWYVAALFAVVSLLFIVLLAVTRR